MEKYVEVHLGYFKQGDDLADCLESEETSYEALKAHAEMLKAAADQLDKIAEKVKDKVIEIEADTHSIIIKCDEDLAADLIKEDLAQECEDFEDEDFDEEIASDYEESEENLEE